MDIYKMITTRIVDLLKAGCVPWHKPWAGGYAGYPKNLISKKEYRGVNVFLLSCMAFASPYWLSFKQCRELGGAVKKGQKGCPIVYWKMIEKKDDNGEATEERIPMLKYYTVFNVDQCDIPADKLPVCEALPQNDNSPIEMAESIIDSMPNCPRIEYIQQRAFYNQLLDMVNVPPIETFDNSEEYYCTVFHELVHSTKHENRLNRGNKTCEPDFYNSHAYTKEELVAEMGAAFLCGFAGIVNNTINNSASYIDSWLKVINKDDRILVIAAAHAQKAADYILDRKEVS